MLETRRSVGWVNQQLVQREAQTARINEAWRTKLSETLSGDEIYSIGQPNQREIGNDSLYIYALTCQPGFDGETSGCAFVIGQPEDGAVCQ